MKKNSGQVLILVVFIMIVFIGVTLIITTLTNRELEMREIGEKSLKAQYAADAGWERAKYYIKTTDEPISLRETIEGSLSNNYVYTTNITPFGMSRVDGSDCSCSPIPAENCCCSSPGNYCIDSFGESPQ